eukprot:198204-Rhodomonas_salina.2
MASPQTNTHYTHRHHRKQTHISHIDITANKDAFHTSASPQTNTQYTHRHHHKQTHIAHIDITGSVGTWAERLRALAIDGVARVEEAQVAAGARRTRRLRAEALALGAKPTVGETVGVSREADSTIRHKTHTQTHKETHLLAVKRGAEMPFLVPQDPLH